MAVLAFLASSLYWPGISGAATSPRWALIAVTVPWLLHEQRVTVAHLMGGLFLAWAAMTVLWSASSPDGIGALFILLILAACFVLGSQFHNLRPIYIGAGLGLWLSSVVALWQWSGWEVVHTITPISGLFANGNFMAEAAALIAVAAVVERIWWLIPGLLPALILPGCRGALLACAVALAIHCRAHWRLIAPVAVLVLVGVAAHFLRVGDPASAARLEIWQMAMSGMTVFGNGLGSIPGYAHNEFLHVAFELGLVGLVLFCLFCLTLIGPLDTARLVLIALFVEACFAYPLHLPTTGFLGLIVAGYAVRNRYLLWNSSMRGRGIGETRMASDRLSSGYEVPDFSRTHRAF